MKNRLYLLFALVALLVFSLPVLAKGRIEDGDAFDTYMGKTKAEVKRIAPFFILDDPEEGIYKIDSDGLFSIYISFYNGKVACIDSSVNVNILEMTDMDLRIEVIETLFEIAGVSDRKILDTGIENGYPVYYLEDGIFAYLITGNGITDIAVSRYM